MITRRAFPITILAAALLLASGCRTVSPQPVITPARVSAVTALAAYAGGKALIVKGHRAELEQATAALEVISGAGTVDLTAVAAALEAAGLSYLGTEEGSLAVGAVIVFSDLWAGTAQPILDSEHGRAVVQGLVRGFRLALGPATRGAWGTQYDDLEREAVASRTR